MKKLAMSLLGVSMLNARVIGGHVPLAMQDMGAHQVDNPLVSSQMLSDILQYKQGYGAQFLHFQTEWFKPLFLYITLGVLAVFLLHYLIIGAKKFSHDGERYYVFSLFMRLVHWIAALGFVLIVPTGFMMIFGEALGGGSLVLNARHLHSVGAVLFAIAVIPMFLVWLIPMLPTLDDLKWLFIAGGYLSRKKREIPAGKFNAGQKMWFWLATLGGLVMIGTGALMYFQKIDVAPLLSLVGVHLNQIEALRLSAIVHNFLGMAVAALFITHLYMSIFAIKGSLSSMIDGYKSEDELKYLHSTYYKKLIRKLKKTAS
jgi:formate dehydrogenase subunit gamma